MARKPSDTVQLKLRFDEKLRRKLEQSALKNKQSMNAEIVERLEKSFTSSEIADVTAEKFLSTLEKLLQGQGVQEVRDSPLYRLMQLAPDRRPPEDEKS
jgi:signal recognition particle GTPase